VSASSFAVSRVASAGRFLPRIEELFAFAFGAAVAREALWRVPGSLGPVVAASAFGVVVALVVRRGGGERPAPPLVFWGVVALPILALWALRAPFPDVGYDTLNYHLLHGERGLWGPVHAPGDFYPFFFPNQNPTGDLVTAMFRAALGYRGGTLAAALALVWSGEVLWRLLATAVRDERLRAAAVLVAVTGEGLLWEVSGYMVDLLALPLLLEATTLATAEVAVTPRSILRKTTLLGLLLGTSVALKLTHLVFAVPIGLVALARWLGPREARPAAREAVTALAAGAVAFVLPVAPHAVHVFIETGNPVFPYFNKLFASPYFPLIDAKDGRWGPTSPVETLLWPLLSALRSGRLSEFAVTTGRLAAGWLAAALAIPFLRAERRTRGIAVIVLLGGVLWSLGTGYHRYGLYGELLGGALLVLLVAHLAGPASTGVRSGRRIAAQAVLILAGVQSVAGIALAVRAEWGGRTSLLKSPAAGLRESAVFLRDRDLRSFLPAEARAAIPDDLVWIDAGVKGNGIMALLDRDAPMIGLQVEAILEMPQNLRRLDTALAAVRGRPALALAFREDAERSEAALGRLGFPVRRRVPFDLPFFSKRNALALSLLEVDLPPPLGAPPADGVATPWVIDVGLLGAMDGPVDGQEVSGELLVRGWARIPEEDLALEIWIGNRQVLPPVLRRVPRPDVARAVPGLGDCSSAGYEALVPRPPGTPEKVRVFVVFRSRSGRMRAYPAATIVWREAGSRISASP
jgi:hypothetical protein